MLDPGSTRVASEKAAGDYQYGIYHNGGAPEQFVK